VSSASLLLLVADQTPAADDGPHALPFLLVGCWALLLAIFVGVELISKVPATLHTPLMSGSNAISGITIVGALYCAGTGYPLLGQILGFFAIAMAMVNVVGGFLVTDRMLRMFGAKKPAARAPSQEKRS
jgi:H+-translocating NAD(P) transhydrogenase subunit alpha